MWISIGPYWLGVAKTMVHSGNISLEPVNVLYFEPKDLSETSSKLQSKQGAPFGFQDDKNSNT